MTNDEILERLLDIAECGYIDVEDVKAVFAEAEEKERFELTPWGYLSFVLNDFNINTDNITGKMGEHIVNDFMEAMEKAGYVERRKDD